MTKCTCCGEAKAGTKVLSEFDASGLLGTPFPVFIHDAVKEKHCTECGDVLGHIIPMPDNLIAVAAVLRAINPLKLNGDEIRFLRKSVGLKSKEMAKRLEISSEQYSRFETGKKPITEVYEKLLRAEVCLHHLESLRHIDVDIRGLLAMKIISVRDISKPIAYDDLPDTASYMYRKTHGDRPILDKQEAHDVARAAIEAMRDCDNDMLEAMHTAMFEDKFTGGELPMLNAGWVAALDKALEE